MNSAVVVLPFFQQGTPFPTHKRKYRFAVVGRKWHNITSLCFKSNIPSFCEGKLQQADTISFNTVSETRSTKYCLAQWHRTSLKNISLNSKEESAT
jgi:hypothetical protein